MHDREKVMSALDCRANDTDIDCRKCDYYIREDKPEYCDFRGMLRDALALLNEQQQQIWELQDQVEYLEDKRKEQEAVVRCKDCKHGREPILAYRKGCVWCERVNRHNDADWFCADGVAKDINVPNKEGR